MLADPNLYVARVATVTESPAAARIHGLDTLRACAIVLVVLHHYRLFVGGGDDFGWLGAIGWVGVDLFFALSGYLIGNQIFMAMRGAPGFSARVFYLRRALRTLPNYWVVLALYWLSASLRNGAPLAPPWRYLSFTLNLGLAPGTAFSHAWSLCIEEQFYLLLPALALLIAATARPLRTAWTVIGLALLGGCLLRAANWQAWIATAAHAEGGYYTAIYYATLCRLDELVVGVALALVKSYHPRRWRQALRHGRVALAIGVVACALGAALFAHDRLGLTASTFGYPLLALGFGALLLSALSKNSPLATIPVPGARGLALWSYAIYLTHRIVFTLSDSALQTLGVAHNGALARALMFALSVLAGWLLYRLIETPFMALRARWAVPGAPLAALQ
jgi:peptidoglycan/LPS O-acetylase OafA/YrhL